MNNSSLGTKAANLFTMLRAGINVPKLICFEDIGLTADEINAAVKEAFGGCGLFSVRSSSNTEDSKDFSFAGQFDTYLNIKREDVPEFVEKCRQSAHSETIGSYCRSKGLNADAIKVNVIVQQMICADMSGVLFTANPLGILNETVIAVGCGTGNNIVEDRVPVTTYYYNTTDSAYCFEQQANAPLLSDRNINELVETSRRIKELFGEYLDIEFAIKDGEIFILQARPITTLNTENTVILDNSNIVESYPGITLPLTEGFVNRMYSGVFRAMISRLIKNKKLLGSYESVFNSMTASANGRMYYKISNWYSVLGLLPCSKMIIPVWQDMLGVSEKDFDSGRAKIPAISKAAEYFRAARELLRAQTSNEELNIRFRRIEADFKASFSPALTLGEMREYYVKIEKELINEWDVTLINDLYTFIFAGLLKAALKRAGIDDYERKANDCISNVTNLESMKPVRSLALLAVMAKESGEIDAIASSETHEDALAFLSGEMELASKINAYIDEYGDRYLEELKLESKTFRTNSELLLKTVSEYSENIGRLQGLTDIDEPQKPLCDVNCGYFTGKLIAYLTSGAAKGIRCREISRLNRSRVFGMVRTLFLAAGKQLEQSGAIEKADDVFYLNMDEVFSASTGSDFRSSVCERKAKYAAYASMPAFSRLVFAGREFSKNTQMTAEKSGERDVDTLSGTPCSSGTVEGEVVVIDRPGTAADTKGKILVAKMTDPGWVFMLANAAGIISEKGSMLSHTAIISRELGIPAVVGVDNATSALRSGDRVRLSGESGKIIILDRNVKKYA